MYKKINDFQMHYEEQGSGQPLLLIHGYPLNSEMWEPQISALSDRVRVITPDLRGHGLSEAAPPQASEQQAYTMDMHARDCGALLDVLGITQPVVIAGLSMGGYIAFAFLRSFADRVAGLVLAATRAGADSPAARENRSMAVKTTQEVGISPVIESLLPKLLSPAASTAHPDLPARLAEIMANNSIDAFISDQLGMMDRPDSTAMLEHINLPTLLVHGADDQIIPLEDVRIMKEKIPSAEMQIIPDAGHMVNMEQPQRFNQAVKDFLRRMV